MREVLTSSAKERKPPKVLEALRVEPAADTTESEFHGATVQHQFTHYEHKNESHPFGETEGAQLLGHIAEHLGIKHDMPSEPNAEKETGGNIPEKK